MSHAKMRLWNDFYCNSQDIIQTYSNSSFLQDMRDQNPRRTVKKKQPIPKSLPRILQPENQQRHAPAKQPKDGESIRTFQLTCRKQEQNSTNPAEAKLILHIDQENEEEEETFHPHSKKQNASSPTAIF